MLPFALIQYEPGKRFRIPLKIGLKYASLQITSLENTQNSGIYPYISIDLKIKTCADSGNFRMRVLNIFSDHKLLFSYYEVFQFHKIV